MEFEAYRRKKIRDLTSFAESVQWATGLQQKQAWGNQWPAYDGYKTLNGGQHEIRLLDICIEPNSPVLSAKLRHVLLADAPAYSALSYSWGAPVPTRYQRPIFVDGTEVLIRPTLASFLHSLVQITGPITVWLDALCINQRDLDEKKAQVGTMGRIYTMAQRTYAWLGEGSAESDYVCQSLKEKVHPVPVEEFDSYVQQVWKRPYWDRAWIVQEFVLSREIQLLIGDHMLSVDELLHVTSTDLQKDMQVSKLTPIKGKVAGRLHSCGSMEELTRMIFTFKYSRCSEPRDRIYSLLSLVNTGIEPDYALPISEIIFRMTHALTSSCTQYKRRLIKDWVGTRPVEYFRALAACIKPSIDDIFAALELPGPPFALTLEPNCPVRDIKSYEEKLSSLHMSEYNVWYVPKDSIAKIKGAYLFSLAKGHHNPFSQLHVAVTSSYEVVGVICTEHSPTRRGSVPPQEQKLPLNDLTFLSSIMSQHVTLCRKRDFNWDKRLPSEKQCFHVSKILLAFLSLLGRSNQGESLPSQIPEVYHQFVTQLKSSILPGKSVSSACRDTEGWDFTLATISPGSSTPGLAYCDRKDISLISGVALTEAPLWKEEGFLLGGSHKWSRLLDESRQSEHMKLSVSMNGHIKCIGRFSRVVR